MKPDCPMQFHGIDHVVLQVTDSERALHFYTQILGLTVERVIEDLQIYQLRCGRNLIDLRVLPQRQEARGEGRTGHRPSLPDAAGGRRRHRQLSQGARRTDRVRPRGIVRRHGIRHLRVRLGPGRAHTRIEGCLRPVSHADHRQRSNGGSNPARGEAVAEEVQVKRDG